jgi:hypothetical protein
MRRSRIRRPLYFLLGLVFGVLAYLGMRFGPVVKDFADAGFIEGFSPVKQKRYRGTSMENLKAIHVAMMLYHDSEGGFPIAESWMDSIKTRLKTSELTSDEALKKLKNPLLEGDDVWGYAMNRALSGKYKDDIGDPGRTWLVFDSSDTKWNANGDPKALLPNPPRPGGNLGITVSGKAGVIP